MFWYEADIDCQNLTLSCSKWIHYPNWMSFLFIGERRDVNITSKGTGYVLNFPFSVLNDYEFSPVKKCNWFLNLKAYRYRTLYRRKRNNKHRALQGDINSHLFWSYSTKTKITMPVRTQECITKLRPFSL